jgi:hypothetical protein
MTCGSSEDSFNFLPELRKLVSAYIACSGLHHLLANPYRPARNHFPPCKNAM